MIVKREKEIVIVIFLKFVDEEEKKKKISSFLVVVVSLIIIEKYKIIIIEYIYTTTNTQILHTDTRLFFSLEVGRSRLLQNQTPSIIKPIYRLNRFGNFAIGDDGETQKEREKEYSYSNGLFYLKRVVKNNCV